MKIDRTKNYQIYTNYFHPSRSKLFSHKKTFFVREKTFFQNLQTQLGAPYDLTPQVFSISRNCFMFSGVGRFIRLFGPVCIIFRRRFVCADHILPLTVKLTLPPLRFHPKSAIWTIFRLRLAPVLPGRPVLPPIPAVTFGIPFSPVLTAAGKGQLWLFRGGSWRRRGRWGRMPFSGLLSWILKVCWVCP